MTVAEAADVLGVSKEAVRKRISRGTLRSDRGLDGMVRVYVPESPTSSGTASGAFDRDELIAELRARVEDLRTDRDAWRDQARRSDYIAGAAMDRTRELESRLRELEPGSSSEATESDPSPGPTRTPTDAGDVPETPTEMATEPRPWWRRLFGS